MKKKFFIGLFVVVVIGLFVFAHLALKNNEQQYQAQQNLSAPIEVPDKNVMTFEDAEKLDKPMVVMFYVDWCTYCRRFMPIFGEFANKYKDKYSFAVINCDKLMYEKMVKDFNIMGFPTVFIVDKKFDLRFTLQMASMADKSVMTDELDRYLKSRAKMLQK
ncbi:MAG: redoxin domain-containing protein [Candidatus Gastranaerophilales bacterium]|nr:redoxin domain-containing protein [Candidatus Gastranaerophilales bacterium]